MGLLLQGWMGRLLTLADGLGWVAARDLNQKVPKRVGILQAKTPTMIPRLP